MSHRRSRTSFIVVGSSDGGESCVKRLHATWTTTDVGSGEQARRCVSAHPRRLVYQRGPDATTLRGWLAFDGVAVGETGDSVFESGAAAMPNRGGLRDVGTLSAAVSQMRGNFTLAAQVAGDDVFVAGDELGGAPIFTYHARGCVFLTNDVWLLDEAVTACGMRLGRHPTLFGVEAIFGSGAFRMTGFDGLTLARMGEHFVVRPDGVCRTLRRLDLPAWYGAEPDREASIERAERDIRGNVRALGAGGYRDRVSDLTGGVDSRLVLAALFAEGLEDRFEYTCSGAFPGPDFTTYDYLVHILDLRAGQARSKSEVPFEEDPIGALAMVLRRTMGCYAHAFDPGVQGDHTMRSLHLKGGFAEILRSFYSGDFDADKGDSPIQHLLRRVSWATLSNFLQPEFGEQVMTLLRRYFAEREDAGVGDEDALDQWYVENRNRYHFGVTWMARLPAKTVFHPLYSTNALRAAYALTPSSRARRAVAFELMTRLCSPLTSLPFADFAWDPSLWRTEHDRSLHALRRPVTSRSVFPSRWHSGPGRQRSATTASATLRRASSQEPTPWRARLIRRGRPPWEVRFDRVLPVARSVIIDSGRDSDIWQIFDREACLQLLDRELDRPWKRYEIRLVYKMLAAAIWTDGSS